MLRQNDFTIAIIIITTFNNCTVSNRIFWYDKGMCYGKIRLTTRLTRKKGADRIIKKLYPYLYHGISVYYSNNMIVMLRVAAVQKNNTCYSSAPIPRHEHVGQYNPSSETEE